MRRHPVAGDPLASQPTISRFENGATRVIERHARRLDGRARRIVIDQGSEWLVSDLGIRPRGGGRARRRWCRSTTCAAGSDPEPPDAAGAGAAGAGTEGADPPHPSARPEPVKRRDHLVPLAELVTPATAIGRPKPGSPGIGPRGSPVRQYRVPPRPSGPSAVPSINIRTIGELVSSRESFHAAKKVHRSTHGTGTRGLSTDAPQAQRGQRESAPRSGSLEGRCGRAGVDRRADRRRLFVPHQDRREHSPTMRAARVRAGAGTKTAGVPPGPQTAQRRTGGSHHRPASGAAPEGLRELVVAPAGAAGRRVGGRRVDQPRNHPADAKKTG